MSIELTKLFISESLGGQKEISADFNNDRHHFVMIHHPHGIKQVADALRDLAINIMADPYLLPSENIIRGSD